MSRRSIRPDRTISDVYTSRIAHHFSVLLANTRERM
jgi:hypothetical protein